MKLSGKQKQKINLALQSAFPESCDHFRIDTSKGGPAEMDYIQEYQFDAMNELMTKIGDKIITALES